jgi:phenylpropionate dioxygenase-like ring-hydroxylating dioxygenase large terminal subunit
MITDPILFNDWHPVASLAQLQVQPLCPVRLLGEDLVIWRTDERVMAWQDLCIHRGTRLSLGKIREGCLACPYHGWVYNQQGICVHIPAHPEQLPPAKARVKVYQVQERYGLIWVCLGEPSQDIPPFPEWADARFATAICGPYAHIPAHGPRLVENFLDAAHFAFVHEGVLGDPSRAEIGDYETHHTASGIESDPVEVYQPNPYGDQAGKVAYVYRAFRPLTAHFNKYSPNATNGLLLTITPHDELDSTVWFIVATTTMQDNDALQQQYSPRIAAIFAQDQAIVETQRPELLPLDLQAELHLRSDRMAIAYRKWLGELGLHFGTA